MRGRKDAIYLSREAGRNHEDVKPKRYLFRYGVHVCDFLWHEERAGYDGGWQEGGASVSGRESDETRQSMMEGMQSIIRNGQLKACKRTGDADAKIRRRRC